MNKFERRSKASYDKKAKKYEATFDGRFTFKFRNMLFQSVSIGDDDVIADIACGNGALLHQLKRKKSFIGYGVDISEKMIEQAKIRNPEMEFYVASCEQLPFENAQIDIMTVCAAYHHFPHVDQFAAEASRVIKENGLLFIADIYLPAVLRTICNPFVKFSRAGDVKFYAPEEILALFEHNGFVAKGKTIRGRVQLIVMQRR